MRIGQRSRPNGQPTVPPSQQGWNQGELEFIHAIHLQELRSQLGTAKQHQVLNTCRGKQAKTIRPGRLQREPAMKPIDRWGWSEQPTLQRLLKETPVNRECAAMAHHHRRRLSRPTIVQPLLHQGWIPNQTSALMGSQCASAQQTGIRPDQRPFQFNSITGTAELGRTTLRRGEPTIKADRQNQSNKRPLWVRGCFRWWQPSRASQAPFPTGAFRRRPQRRCSGFPAGESCADELRWLSPGC